MRPKDSCPVWGEGAGKVPDRQLADALLYVPSGSEGAGFRQRNPATRHLLRNIGDALRHVVERHGAALRRAIRDVAADLASERGAGEPKPRPEPTPTALERRRAEARAQRQAAYDEAVRMRGDGATLADIAAALGTAPRTLAT